jgi:hypothetical protein
MVNDGGVGPETTMHLCQLGGSLAGAKLGSIIGSVFPGFGTLVGAFVGGILGGLIGSKLGNLLCCLFPTPAAKGNGPPPLEFMPFLFDFPECEFVVDIYGPPEIEYGAHKYARKVPEIEFAPFGINGAPKLF